MGHLRGSLPLRAELALGLSLLLGGVVLATYWLSWFGIPAAGFEGASSRARARVLSRVGVVADLQKSRLSDWLAERAGGAKALASDPLVVREMARRASSPRADEAAQALDPESLDRELRSLLAAYSSVTHAAVALPSGRIAVQAGTGTSRYPPEALQAWLSEPAVASQGRFRIVEQSPVTSGYAMQFAHAIRGEHGESLGAVVLTVDALATLRTLLPVDHALGETSEVVLVNAQRETLMPLKFASEAGERGRPLYSRISARPASLAARGNEGVIEAADYRGVPVLAAYRHVTVLNDVGWGLVAKVDRDEVLGPDIRATRALAWLHALAALVVVALGTLFIARRTRGIARLTAIAGQVERGAYPRVSIPKGPRDVEQLGRALGMMLDRQRDWNEELEGRVQRRTAELERSNRRLAQEVEHHEHARAEVQQLNAVLTAIRKVNQAIVGAESSTQLAQATCDRLIEHRGYRCVWVTGAAAEGRDSTLAFALSREAKEALPRAIAGGDKLNCLSHALSSGLSGARERVCDRCSLNSDGRETVLLEQEIRYKHERFGALIVAAESGTVVERERQLLGELTADLALGLHVLEQRKRAELLTQTLAEARDRQRAILDASPSAIVVCDSSEQTILNANSQAAQLAGVSEPQHLIGRDASAMVAASSFEAFAELLKDSAQHGRATRLDLRLRRGASSEYPADLHAARLDSSSGETGAGCQTILVWNDVSERKELESKLLASQRLESVGRLAGGVAHDFNNLVTVILTCSEFILESLPADSPSAEDAHEINKAGERAKALTNQLLAFSRRQVLQPSVLSINDVIVDLRLLLARLLPENIDVSFELAADLWPVEVDRGQLEQIVLNLVVNARDAMPEGGDLLVETFNRELDSAYARRHAGSKPGHHAALVISDSGTGMPPEVQSQIFEPFYTTKQMGSGTGLGLSTVFGIVKQSGASIGVHSEEGLGTTFKLCFPRSLKKPHLLAVSSSPPRVVAEAARIVVVEDDAPVRRSIARALRRHGYTIYEFASGADALDYLRRAATPPALLVTDVIMPGMGGQALAQAAQDLCPEMLTLFVSGYTENSIVHHGVLDEGVLFLSKPFTEPVLVDKVREILERTLEPVALST